MIRLPNKTNFSSLPFSFSFFSGCRRIKFTPTNYAYSIIIIIMNIHNIELKSSITVKKISKPNEFFIHSHSHSNLVRDQSDKNKFHSFIHFYFIFSILFCSFYFWSHITISHQQLQQQQWWWWVILEHWRLSFFNIQIIKVRVREIRLYFSFSFIYLFIYIIISYWERDTQRIFFFCCIFTYSSISFNNNDNYGKLIFFFLSFEYTCYMMV